MRYRAGSVSIKDCIVQTFRAGGPGGQNQNKRDTAVRVIHSPSGAVGESREQRSQLQNKRSAFRRMALSARFREWCLSTFSNVDVPPSHSDERVRTYNVAENRVVDHRSGKRSARVQDVLDGDLDLVRSEGYR